MRPLWDVVFAAGVLYSLLAMAGIPVYEIIAAFLTSLLAGPMYIPRPVNGYLYNYVTCGSVVKLLNTNHRVRLHSHEVQYGSGSGQQSVTAIEDMDDVGSHWVIKGLPGKHCVRGQPVTCKSEVRLEHLSTRRNLHSHLFTAPLSGGQEVSAFGKEGEGDTGDIWQVLCDGEQWDRDDNIMLKHRDTGKYLSVSGHRYGHPISGQMEVSCIGQPSSSVYWQTHEGVYIKPTENLSADHRHDHSEL